MFYRSRCLRPLRVATSRSLRASGTIGALQRVGRNAYLISVDGTSESLDNAIRGLTSLKPRQIMLETCAQRCLLAQRRFREPEPTAIDSARISEDEPSPSSGSKNGKSSGRTGSPLTHADAIDVVHGGVLGHDIVPLLRVANVLDAQVYEVDRPYQDTQNGLARCLALKPSELLAFARHFAASLGVEQRVADGDLKAACPSVYSILVDERERYMVTEFMRRAVPGADAVLICTPERISGLRAILENEPIASAPQPAIRRSRIWPFLLILGYLVVPVYGSILLAWRVSRWIADVLAEVVRGVGLPALLGQESSDSRPADVVKAPAPRGTSTSVAV